MKPVYFDLETDVDNVGDDAVGDMSASPYCMDNNICYMGLMVDMAYSHTDLSTSQTETLQEFANRLGEATGPAVAHNISFDLEYLLYRAKMDIDEEVYESLVARLLEIGLWDTQLAAYLLSGQQHKWATLDQLATQYGGVVKDSRMKEYWKAGVKTPDIPKEEILPYLEWDVRNLEIIYEAQVLEAEEKGMLPFIMTQMKARLCTIVMQVNGMHFDKERAVIVAGQLRRDVEALEKNLISQMLVNSHQDFVPNPGSTKHLAAYLFGGVVNYEYKAPLLDDDGTHVVFKSGIRKGQPRFRNMVGVVEYPGIMSEAVVKPERTSSGGIKCNAELLDKLVRVYDSDFAETVLEYRNLKKSLTTYFAGYAALTWPDGLIHGSLNHCQTDTGRLSSSKPNMQNISNKSHED